MLKKLSPDWFWILRQTMPVTIPSIVPQLFKNSRLYSTVQFPVSRRCHCTRWLHATVSDLKNASTWTGSGLTKRKLYPLTLWVYSVFVIMWIKNYYIHPSNFLAVVFQLSNLIRSSNLHQWNLSARKKYIYEINFWTWGYFLSVSVWVILSSFKGSSQVTYLQNV